MCSICMCLILHEANQGCQLAAGSTKSWNLKKVIAQLEHLSRKPGDLILLSFLLCLKGRNKNKCRITDTINHFLSLNCSAVPWVLSTAGLLCCGIQHCTRAQCGVWRECWFWAPASCAALSGSWEWASPVSQVPAGTSGDRCACTHAGLARTAAQPVLATGGKRMSHSWGQKNLHSDKWVCLGFFFFWKGIFFINRKKNLLAINKYLTCQCHKF